jgi:hypothetical protein
LLVLVQRILEKFFVPKLTGKKNFKFIILWKKLQTKSIYQPNLNKNNLLQKKIPTWVGTPKPDARATVIALEKEQNISKINSDFINFEENDFSSESSTKKS